MNNLTAKVTTENDGITAWVYIGNKPWIRQPYDPNNGPFESDAEALAWAEDFIVQQQNASVVEPE